MKQIKVAFVLLSLALLGAGFLSCSSAIKAWAPKAQAEAEIMLRTPTPAPTRAPAPTLAPQVVAAREAQQEQTEHTKGAAGRAVLTVLTGCACVVLASVAVAALSGAARHARATVQLAPMASLPRGSHVQIAGGVLDKRTGAWTAVGGEDKPPDHERMRIEAGERAEVAGALTAAVLRPVEKPRSLVDLIPPERRLSDGE